jgi:psiF repeat
MKTFALMLALGLTVTLAHAADTEKSPQQNKMASCNAEAGKKELKGEERKAFMKECLSAGKASAQQSKMKTCNADAAKKELKGDERKAFMAKCLKAA